MATKQDWRVPDGTTIIFRPWIKLKDGRILYAKAFGKKAWPIKVREAKPKGENPPDKG